MPRIAPVDPDKLHRAFLEAFADYAMDASGTTEERLLLRMRKNAVDYPLSPGLYDGDRLVGFTLIGVDRWRERLTAYDAATGIVPEFRKRGWAQRMFDRALPALTGKGVKRFVLEVLRGNDTAIKAYRKSGFEIVRELKCYTAEADALRSLSATPTVEIRPIVRADFHGMEASADWVPSFENRFAAVDAIPDQTELTGAFVGGHLAGASAYSPDLNWLLSLLVSREHRRRGVATALIRHAATMLPRTSSHLSALNVDGDADGTQSFFESLGFRHLVDQYEMARELQTEDSR